MVKLLYTDIWKTYTYDVIYLKFLLPCGLSLLSGECSQNISQSEKVYF